MCRNSSIHDSTFTRLVNDKLEEIRGVIGGFYEEGDNENTPLTSPSPAVDKIEEIKENENVKVDSPPQNKHPISIITEPSGAKVFINSDFVGHTNTDLYLLEGQYNVSLHLTGKDTFHSVINLPRQKSFVHTF
ncbi:MAG: PEGA domain-containing protein [Saprospiraceae bacterium]